jgi:GMP synthase-like glutamine amidotransferase
MRVQILQHAAFEGPGRIETALTARRARLAWTRLFEGDTLPPLDDLDLIVAMGGPMSVNDEDALAWLRPEKQFIRDAAARSIPMLGVCLGAQLIANALGAEVARGQREIGWFRIEATPSEDATPPFAFSGSRTVFHWHGETFALPPGAVRLARSAACANQAFALPGRIIGLQFHLEMTRQTIAGLVAHCGDELTSGPYVQNAAEMLAVPDAQFGAMHTELERVIEYLASNSAGAG